MFLDCFFLLSSVEGSRLLGRLCHPATRLSDRGVLSVLMGGKLTDRLPGFIVSPFSFLTDTFPGSFDVLPDFLFESDMLFSLTQRLSYVSPVSPA